MLILLILLAILIIVVGYFIITYNRFQTLKNGGEATLGQIKVALKKRLDKLTQLVETVKNYANFEKGTLEKIVELRSSIASLNTPAELSEAERFSRNLLKGISITVENYPELKTNTVVKDLTEAIKEIEDEIARHRYTYNNIIQEYNTMIDTIPSNIVANFMGFRKMDYLEFEEEIEKRPDLSW